MATKMSVLFPLRVGIKAAEELTEFLWQETYCYER